jgi:cytochrome c556
MTGRLGTWSVSVAVMGCLTAGLIVGCARAQQTAKTPDQIVEERQQLMKEHGAAWKHVQDQLKAGTLDGVVADAEKMSDNAKRIPVLFPEGSMTAKSNAKPEVWQKKSEFDAAARNFGDQAEKLKAAAQTNDMQAVQTVAKDFGRNACGTCHTPFRVPPRQ